ncbi:preprotein translocase subunit YajC [Paenibacillus graminis]|uniref:preprotein translocase subunit YajC n=1 Tax=Paenibacillus graminis TaxID=189425 RepID=UPI002DBDF67C|nr:preprotein translocase subunit YajC [Paenibacillus graminis]MEC0167377.1 preprotein translocase subunit YajC [Paenibacillus graminis]
MNEREQHANTIRQLLQKDRNEVGSQHLDALLNGVRKGELSVDDILEFTNISREQLNKMVQGE